MKLSIIVPVYNTSKFLEKCIQSILDQSYRDYELLLVDDGSTDHSGDICDQFAAKDARVKVFHKSNGGVDSARNLGIEKAQGEYFYFVDSDDELLPECLDTLISGMKTEDIDLVIGGYIYSRDGINDEMPKEAPTSRIFSRNETMEELLLPKYHSLGMPWTNLYKASIIHENNLWFNQAIHTIDDRVFMVSYICAMKGNAFHTTKPIYIYNLGVGVSFNIKKKFDKRTATIFDGQCLIFEMVKDGGFSSKCEWWARFKMMNSYYFKKKYFEQYRDYDTVKKMKEKLFSLITRKEYIYFWCRKKIATIVKPVFRFK
jgi:glycosyltransferase involved in cell wall biosynthesis